MPTLYSLQQYAGRPISTYSHKYWILFTLLIFNDLMEKHLLILIYTFPLIICEIKHLFTGFIFLVYF